MTKEKIEQENSIRRLKQEELARKLIKIGDFGEDEFEELSHTEIETLQDWLISNLENKVESLEKTVLYWCKKAG